MEIHKSGWYWREWIEYEPIFICSFTTFANYFESFSKNLCPHCPPNPDEKNIRYPWGWGIVTPKENKLGDTCNSNAKERERWALWPWGVFVFFSSLLYAMYHSIHVFINYILTAFIKAYQLLILFLCEHGWNIKIDK